jgi:hypothetical protein
MSYRFLVVLGLLAACGGGDGVCGEIYDKQKACWEKDENFEKMKDEMPSKAEFVAMCKAATKSRKEEVDVMAECIKEDGCEAIEACMDKKHDELYAKKRAEELDGYIKEGKWSEGFKECQYAGEQMKKDEKLAAACEKVFSEGIPKLTGKDLEDVTSACKYTEELRTISPAFKKACEGVMGAEFEAKKKAALEARDQALDDYSRCFDLQAAAESLGDEKKKDAEQICAQINAARSAKQALDEANASIAAKKGEMSYYCTSSAEELKKLDPPNEWSTKKLDEVLKTCFLDLGKVIIEAELPNMSSFCPYSVTQLREAVATYALLGKDADFDALIGKTEKVCKQ